MGRRGKMFPKKGKTFPGGDRDGHQEGDYVAAIAEALQAELGDTHRAVKTAMRWTGANERTVKNWHAGTSGPRGAHLVALVRHSDLVLDAFLRLAGCERIITRRKLISMRHKLQETIELIDTVIRAG